MRTSNLDKVLAQVTGADCQKATDELGRYLDAGLTATRELLAAFLNDLNDECLARWGPHGDSGQAAGLLNHPSSGGSECWPHGGGGASRGRWASTPVGPASSQDDEVVSERDAGCEDPSAVRRLSKE
jgi:hypothetical protein